METLFPELITIVIILILGGLALHRNNLVYNELMRLLDLIKEKGDRDIESGRDWAWRYRIILTKHSYQEMFFKFWRPVKSFYADVDWANPKGE
jgi:hypothetical protein